LADNHLLVGRESQVNLLDKKDADADFITQTLSLINSLISSPGTPGHCRQTS
jgi:hypothetical protein